MESEEEEEEKGEGGFFFLRKESRSLCQRVLLLLLLLLRSERGFNFLRKWTTTVAFPFLARGKESKFSSSFSLAAPE